MAALTNRRLLFSCAILFFLLFSNQPLLAQIHDLPAKPIKTRFINEIGFSMGMGIATMNLNELNKQLQDLQIGTLEEDLLSATMSLYLAGKQGFAGSFDFNKAVASGTDMIDRNVQMSLQTYSLGGTVYLPAYKSNRFNLLGIAGFRFTNLNFEYNPNKQATTNFGTLFSNPPANPGVVHLTSRANEDLNLGGRFQYRLGKKENLKSSSYRFGFDTGYIYNINRSSWAQAGSYNPLPGMPQVKLDNIYFHLTFAGYFNI